MHEQTTLKQLTIEVSAIDRYNYMVYPLVIGLHNVDGGGGEKEVKNYSPPKLLFHMFVCFSPSSFSALQYTKVLTFPYTGVPSHAPAALTYYIRQ